MSPQPPAQPRRLSQDEIALLARHGAERAEMEANQQNDRLDLMERQRAELAAALGVASPLVATQGPAK